MKFNVFIEKALDEQSGTSKNGRQWRKRSYVGVYDNSNQQYPKSIVFDVLGDKIDQLNIMPGNRYEVDVDFETRQWNGRYFLSASCWKATRSDAPQTIQPQQIVASTDQYAALGMQPKQVQPQPAIEDSGLPF